MKTGTGRHPKTIRLMQALHVNRMQAVGILALLWEFAAEYSPDGDLTRWGAEMISGALDWPAGRTSELIDGLVLSGWLDRSEPGGRLVVHDWSEHCPYYIRRRLLKKGNADLQNETNYEKRLPQVAHEQPPVTAGCERSALSSLVQSSPTQPNQDPPPARAREGPEISAELEQAAMRVFGTVPLMQLSEWVEKYGQEWAWEALRRTESKGAGVAYCRGVLEGFARDGGPKNGERGGHRKTTGQAKSDTPDKFAGRD